MAISTRIFDSTNHYQTMINTCRKENVSNQVKHNCKINERWVEYVFMDGSSIDIDTNTKECFVYSPSGEELSSKFLIQP